MYEDDALGFRLQCIRGVTMDFARAAIGNQQMKCLLVKPLQVVEGLLTHDTGLGETAYRRHVLVVADHADITEGALVHRRKGGADGWYGVHGIVYVDVKAVVTQRFTRFDSQQLEMLAYDVHAPAETAGELFHRHVKDFLGRDYLYPVRHFHQRKHRAMIVVQVRQEHRRNLVARYAAREQVPVEKRDRIDQQVIAVVTKGETGTGFICGKPGGAPQHLYAHLRQATGHIVYIHRVRRNDLGAIVQIDVDIAARTGDQVAIQALVLDGKITRHREVVLERDQIEEVLDLHHVTFAIFQGKRLGDPEPLLFQVFVGIPAVKFGAGRAEQGEAQQAHRLADAVAVTDQVEPAFFGESPGDEEKEIKREFEVIQQGAAFLADVGQHQRFEVAYFFAQQPL